MNKNKHIIITRSRIRKMCERAYFKIKQERLDELLRINHLLNDRIRYLELHRNQLLNSLPRNVE
jgi:hypothetical protein